MSSTNDWIIHQLIPADGWAARYEVDREDGKGTEIETSPLAAWALTEIPCDEPDRSSFRVMEGIEADGDGTFFSDSLTNFRGYCKLPQALSIPR